MQKNKFTSAPPFIALTIFISITTPLPKNNLFLNPTLSVFLSLIVVAEQKIGF